MELSSSSSPSLVYIYTLYLFRIQIVLVEQREIIFFLPTILETCLLFHLRKINN